MHARYETQTCIPYTLIATLRAVAEVELTSIRGEDARRSARVDFSAQVELLAQDELEPSPRVIVAQAFDLGAGGMGLALREHLSVGTHVTCRLALDGRDAALDGRVAWLRAHTSPRPHGLGVCFDPLDGYQRELLAHVIDRTRAGYRPVELRFGNVQTPVIARARNTPDGLRVSTPLPMLNRGTELAVRFEGEGQAFVGCVTGVAISEQGGTRRLEVDVVLRDDTGSVRFRRQARYGNADELASADGHDSSPANAAADGHDELTETGQRAARPRRRALAAEGRVAPASATAPALRGSSLSSERDRVSAPRVRERSRTARGVLAGLRIAGSLLLAAACGAGASAWLERSWRAIDARPAPSSRSNDQARANAQPAEPEPTGPAARAEPAAEPGASPRQPSAWPATDEPSAISLRPAGTAVSASARVAAFPIEPQPALPSTPPFADLPAAVPFAPSPAALSAPPSAPTPNLADSLAHTATASKATTAVQAEPTLVVENGVTVVAVPFEGSLDGMRTTTWASPTAVAIDLPHGRARVLHGYYPLSGGIAAGLRIRQRAELLVRVLLAQPVSRIAVTANGESLEIRLTNAP
jgi:hypothetical protein